MTAPVPESEAQRRQYVSDKHAEAARRLMDSAYEKRDQEKFDEAVSLIHRAVVQALKANAELRGWHHHNRIRREYIATRLGYEWNDPRLGLDYSTFDTPTRGDRGYPAHWDRVELDREVAESVINKLEKIRNAPPRPLREESLSVTQREILRYVESPRPPHQKEEQYDVEDIPNMDPTPEGELGLGQMDPALISNGKPPLNWVGSDRAKLPTRGRPPVGRPSSSSNAKQHFNRYMVKYSRRA